MTSNHVEACLKEFARGGRSRSSLEDCLSSEVRLSFWDTSERSSEILGRLPKVRFTRADIDSQLQCFLAEQITARELSDWAGAMRLLGCFVLNEDDPGSSQVWDLMDEIVSPDVWGPLTIESVIELRRRLASES